MQRLLAWLLSALVSTAACAQPERAWQELELIRAHALDWPGNFQPSGLSWCHGRLLTVSDRHDLEIQEIVLTPDRQAEVRLYRQLEQIPEPPPLDSLVDILRQMILTVFQKQYDWEGISCDDQNNLYLASESYSAILKLPENGQAEWLAVGDHPMMESRDILKKPNASIEGIQWLSGNRLLLAAEHSPAGLILCRHGDDRCEPEQVVVLSDAHLPWNIYARDISGLSSDGDRLYLLERQQSRICRRTGSLYRISQCYSFRATEKSPELVHQGATWGQAEGLLVQGDRVYVVIDNNGRALKSNPSSTATWLFEFQRPAAF